LKRKRIVILIPENAGEESLIVFPAALKMIIRDVCSLRIKLRLASRFAQHDKMTL